MALSEFEIKRAEKALNNFIETIRPPANIRKELDFSYRIDDQSVELLEIRPQWNDPSITIETAFAKTTFVKSRNHWKILWQRADLKWHAYDPQATVSSLEEFLRIVKEDAHACFFG